MIKNLLLFTAFIFTGQFITAQATDKPLYQQFPDVPPFSITKVPTNTKFTKADLKKKKATLIMLFSPDCDHCQRQAKEMLANMEFFKNVQIVMVSNLDYELILDFYDDYKIANHPNITMGRDGTNTLNTFYKLHTYPTMALYNKKGHFVKLFEGNVAAQTIAEKL